MKIINLRVMSPGGMAEFDIAINDAGEIVGFSRGADGFNHAVVWRRH